MQTSHFLFPGQISSPYVRIMFFFVDVFKNEQHADVSDFSSAASKMKINVLRFRFSATV